jgi:uncharacterized protein (DUF1778 family)
MSNQDRMPHVKLHLDRAELQVIEDAAAAKGQSLDEFAVSALIRAANEVLAERQVTRLSQTDAALFASMLNETSTTPNDALLRSVMRYNQQIR